MVHDTRGSFKLNSHYQFLGKIYSFTGWLGLLGSVFLLLSLNGNENMATQAPQGLLGMPMVVSAFLLISWSLLLLSFSKDIQGPKKWTTGLSGWAIGAFHLISVPIGTAIGTYTLWILFHHRRQNRHL